MVSIIFVGYILINAISHYLIKYIFQFTAPDGRIIVYGGTNETDKIAILDLTKFPFQWTIPTNITNYPVNLIGSDHRYHTSNLYKNYMIISFGNL